MFVLWRAVFQEDAGVPGGELIKYFGCHVFFAWLFQEDAGVPGGVGKILWLA